MAAVAVKRKRVERAASVKPSKTRRCSESRSSASEDDDQLKAIFQRHFEGQFKPLAQRKARLTQQELLEDEEEGEEEEEEEEEQADDDVDWEGISDDGEEPGANKVLVIEHNDAHKQEEATLSKKELKEFLSGKVPRSSHGIDSIFAQSKLNGAKDRGDGAAAEAQKDEKLNLKNDLALQRLLRESHLLDPRSSSFSSTQQGSRSQSSLDPTGKNRLRALDIRMQTLGAASSVFDGGKMPMSMRKGVTAFRRGAEEKRRRDARENGIVLERETREETSVKDKRRDRGVGGPSVGRYQRGMLVLSKRDVRSIEGPKDDGNKRRGKKGRR